MNVPADGGAPRELERTQGRDGELVLRRRGPHLEVISNGAFLISTENEASSRALVSAAAPWLADGPPRNQNEQCDDRQSSQTDRCKRPCVVADVISPLAGTSDVAGTDLTLWQWQALEQKTGAGRQDLAEMWSSVLHRG